MLRSRPAISSRAPAPCALAGTEAKVLAVQASAAPAEGWRSFPSSRMRPCSVGTCVKKPVALPLRPILRRRCFNAQDCMRCWCVSLRRAFSYPPLPCDTASAGEVRRSNHPRNDVPDRARSSSSVPRPTGCSPDQQVHSWRVSVRGEQTANGRATRSRIIEGAVQVLRKGALPWPPGTAHPHPPQDAGGRVPLPLTRTSRVSVGAPAAQSLRAAAACAHPSIHSGAPP
jgi:hypothetical protein